MRAHLTYLKYPAMVCLIFKKSFGKIDAMIKKAETVFWNPEKYESIKSCCRELLKKIKKIGGAVVVTQLVSQLLPIPEVRGLNPVIGKISFEHLLSTVLKRQK